MFQALEEGIVLIKDDKIMFKNSKFELLMEETGLNNENPLDHKIFLLR